jgi:hypothetical protein
VVDDGAVLSFLRKASVRALADRQKTVARGVLSEITPNYRPLTPFFCNQSRTSLIIDPDMAVVEVPLAEGWECSKRQQSRREKGENNKATHLMCGVRQSDKKQDQ